MTDRDRLIDILERYHRGITTHENLADYLLANGVIIPPAEVGQTVYIIAEPDFADDFVLDVKVNEIGQDFRGLWIGLELPLGMRLSQYVFPNNLGKTVFLTKEEAEEKLKEYNNG
jgi:hypothetical protein